MKMQIKKISSGGILVNKGGKIALVHQSGGSWGFPKGALEEGEKPLDTAIREVGEETGIQEMEFVRDLSIYERTVLTKYPDGPDILVIYMYLFSTEEERLQPDDAGTISAEWFDKSEILSRLTHDQDKEFFTKILNDEMYGELRNNFPLK